MPGASATLIPQNLKPQRRTAHLSTQMIEVVCVTEVFTSWLRYVLPIADSWATLARKKRWMNHCPYQGPD